MMKIAVYIGKKGAETEIRLTELIASLEKGGCECFFVDESGPLAPDTDMVLSVGGDGTFLSVSKLVADSGIPVVGVNMGRLGFLSENRPEDVADALLKGEYTIEDRALLCAVPVGEDVTIEIRGHIKEMKRNFAFIDATLSYNGEVCSTCEMTYFCFTKEVSERDFFFRGCELEE